MLHKLSHWVLSAALIAALPVSAQDTAPSDGSATTETQAPSGNGGNLAGELSTGEEVGTEPQAGDTYVQKEIGDWALQCLKVPEGDDPCQLYQLLKDSEGNAVSEVSIFRLPEGEQVVAGATFIVPLETLLTAQLMISVDGSNPKRYPYSFCNQVGCYARIGLVADDVAQYKRGAQATVSIIPFAAPDQRVDVTMSLSGFTAGLEEASVVNN